MNMIRPLTNILLFGCVACLLMQCTSSVPTATPPLPTVLRATATPPAPTQRVIPTITAYYATNDPPQLVIEQGSAPHVISVNTPILQAVVASHHIALRDTDYGVRIVDTATNTVTELPFACDDIAWHTAPDTLWCIAYANLYVLSPTRTQLTVVAPPQSTFVHAITRPQHAEVWVIQTTNGRNELCRVLPDMRCIAPADTAQWSPDGQRVALVYAQQIQLIDDQGQQYPVSLPRTHIRNVYWLDTSTLVYVTSQQMFIYSIDTQQTTDAPDWLHVTGLLHLE